MKTKLIICPESTDAIVGAGLISQLYKTYPEVDGHKIFLTARGDIYTITNVKPEITPPDEREVIFCTEEPVELLNNRKHVDSQMSFSRISQGKNSENTCRKLIDWLLCKIDK